MPLTNPLAQALINEQDFGQSCRVATTAALAANTRVGNVLTADANGALAAIDGVALAVTDPRERLLVQDEVTGANNGVYDVTDLGSGATPWVLTRSPDFDQDAEVTSGATVFIAEGTANAGGIFTLITADPITVNTTALVFTQTGGGGGDTDAIHDNVAAEISAITEKVTPVADDVLLLEDSAAADAKKKVKVSSLSTGMHPVVDTTELVKGSADATKLFRIEADTNIPTATTVTMTVPAADFEPDDNSASRTPSGSASGDLTGTYPGPTIAANAVTNAKLADVATKTIKGRTTAATGDPEDLTALQARAVLGITLDYFELDADQFEIPVSGDRPASIVNLAPTVADSVNAGLAVNRYDDTDEEARQFSRRIKAGALTMNLKLLWRAQTAPGDTVHDIGWKLYWREIPIGVAPSLTWAGTNDGSKVLTEIANIANDVLFHEVEETLTLVTEGILLDREYQFLLSRVAPAGTDLVGDWVVRRLAVEID